MLEEMTPKDRAWLRVSYILAAIAFLLAVAVFVLGNIAAFKASLAAETEGGMWGGLALTAAADAVVVFVVAAFIGAMVERDDG